MIFSSLGNSFKKKLCKIANAWTYDEDIAKLDHQYF